MNIIMDAITGIRSIRGELNLPPSLELKAMINTSDGSKDILNEHVVYISKLARDKNIAIGEDIIKPQDAATSVKPLMQIFVPLTGLLDIEAEIKRLEKEILKIEEAASQLRKKLANREFVSKAPKEVVGENKAKYDEFIEKIHKIQENIEKLKQLRRKDG